MDLREYLFRKKIGIQQFADELEYSRTHLSLIVHGKSKPSARLAKAIEKATQGEVKASDLLQKKNDFTSQELSES